MRTWRSENFFSSSRVRLQKELVLELDVLVIRFFSYRC
jgi:hypothetical protein